MMRLNSNATVREILTSGALSGVLDGILVILYLVLLAATDLGLAAWCSASGSPRRGSSSSPGGASAS